MNITEPGKINDRVLLLGRSESCLQVVDGGSELALLGGSMTYVAPEVVEQVERFGVEVEKIKRLIILHSHFDHCGLVPFFKRRWPWAVVTASKRAAELLATPKVSGSVAFLNQAATAQNERGEAVKELGAEFSPIEVEETVGEGDVIKVGDVTLEVLEVPGHSSCSIACYDREAKALFASDAVGVGLGEHFFSTGNSNFDLYQQSLSRLAVLAKEHYGVQTGEDARQYLERSVADATRTREMLVDSYRRTGDVRKSTDELVEAFFQSAPEGFMPREVISMVVAQMMKHIARSESAE